jgi:hypothetical protein
MVTSRSYGWLLAAVAIGACGDGLAATGPVVTRVEPASAAQCPSGGSVVSSGLDTNANAVLDDVETVTQTVLCNDPPAQPPPVVVVRIVAEPIGANCADGGAAVQSGPDRNRNGQLDDNEVAHTDYLCGDTALLTRLVPEPVGAHCVAGGLALRIGRDLDGDHELDDGEVERTEYECGDILSRNIAIHSQADALAIAHIRVIQGSLRISDPPAGPDGSFEAIVLPDLEQVRDELTVSVKLATRLSLPKLQMVGATTEIADNSLLSVIEVPALIRLGGSLDVSRNPELLDLTDVLPPVVAGDLRITDNAKLTTAPLPFEVAGRIDISGNVSLSALTIFASEQTGPIRVAGNGAATLELTAHAIADGDGVKRLSSVQVIDNPRMSRMAIHTDVVGAIEVAGNAVLDEAFLNAVQFEGDVDVSSNPQLVRVSFLGEADVLQIAGAVTMSGPIWQIRVRPFTLFDIRGDLTLKNTLLSTIHSIHRVGGQLRLLANPQLTGVSSPFPMGGLDVHNNHMLETLSTVGQPVFTHEIDVSFNQRLTSLPIENADTFGGNVSIRANPALAALSLRAARVSGQLVIRENSALVDFSADLLQDVETINILSNAQLAQFSLPSLTRAPIVVVDRNAALHHVALPLLTEATTVLITHNLALPSCEVIALLAGITARSKLQAGNDDTASCTP